MGNINEFAWIIKISESSCDLRQKDFELHKPWQLKKPGLSAKDVQFGKAEKSSTRIARKICVTRVDLSRSADVFHAY
jgi:hypothetical protein